MSIRYDQFCALARAAEILGERWTLLITRELLLGPKRFSDLKGRLDGISGSILSQRLDSLIKYGLVERSYLPPPAASMVFQLTDGGLALRPAIFELIRWGGRFLMPARPGERREPEWTSLVLQAYARPGPVPKKSFNLHIRENGHEAVFAVTGTSEGTVISTGPAEADARLCAGFEDVLGLMSGRIDPRQPRGEGLIETEGDPEALACFSQMFA